MDIHLAVALKGVGWHPCAWRSPGTATRALFTPGYWAGLVTEAQAGTLDFVTFEDDPAAEPVEVRVDRVHVSLSAVQLAASTAPRSQRIGLVPAVAVTYTEPFYTSCALATLDFVSAGRAGWQVGVAACEGQTRHVDRGLRPEDDGPAARWQEAGDYVDVVRGLWDSWEDDAEIRDPRTRRFLDADKVHRVDFRGRWFSVAGPSITPRPPQGQPVVCAPERFTSGTADVLFTAPRDAEHARERVRAVSASHVFADLAVVLAEDRSAAEDRLARLDAFGGSLSPDTAVFAGTPAGLAELLLDWRRTGITGFRLRPAVLPEDLRQITRGLVPLLRSHGSFRDDYEADTLRGLLGLGRPANRYSPT